MLVTRGFLGSLVAAALVTGGGMALIPGCSTEAASARAAISISLSNPESGTSVCPAQSGVTLIGSGGVDSQIRNGTATTQADGSQQDGAAISVQCSVSGSDAAGYNVQATTSLAASWTTTIIGNFKPGASGSIGSGIQVQYSDASGFGTFTENDCTATFPGDKEALAAGRARAEVHCPNAPDPNKPGHACEVDVVFEFENCGQ